VGAKGAVVVKPDEPPPAGILEVLTVEASTSVTIDGLDVRVDVESIAGIGIRKGSVDALLRNLTVEGGHLNSINVYEGSQASVARVTARSPSYASVGVWQGSVALLEDSLLEGSPDSNNVGVHVDNSRLFMHATTIRNMRRGIVASAGGMIRVQDFPAYCPLGGLTDVVIESPAGTNLYGVVVTAGSVVEADVRLRITNPGQTWVGDSGGVLVEDGSTFSGGNLEILGSRGQGVIVANNSHADLAGATITGTAHNGVLAVNHATVALAGPRPARAQKCCPV
jgi:hypothetical protein